MLTWLLLSLFSLSSQHECGVGKGWEPNIQKYPHEGRRLETGLDRFTTFEPIRLYFDYSNLTSITPSQLSYLQEEIIPSVKHWFQAVLSVNRLRYNLIVPLTECNDILVSGSHQTEGLSNTDFAVYLSSVDNDTSSAIAYAGPCLQDSGGRFNVLAGSFTINVAIFKTLSKNQAIAVAIHELTHALVFYPGLFSTYVKPDGSNYDENELYRDVYYEKREKVVTLLALPTVLEKAKEVYGCSNIPGLELEDYGYGSAGAHWEMKIVAEDYMISVLPDFPAYSNLTLALFQDSGWYKVDFSYAQPIIIGKNEGCERFEEKCISNGIAQPGFCTESKVMCDYTRTSIGTCTIYEYFEEIPSAYQCFDDPYKGGLPYPDFCPTVYANVNNCRDPNANANSDYGEIVGDSSRCFEASLVLDTLDLSSELYPSCYQVISCEEDHAVIGIGDQTVNCPFTGETVTVSGYTGVLACPDSSICAGVIPCLSSCYGQGKCPKGTCICDAGFGGLDCSIVCDSSCKSCNDQSSCTSCYSTATLADGVCSCPDGSTWDDTQKICMPGTIIGCPKECNGCADETTCAGCYDFITLNDQNLCECPSGKAFNSDTNTCETITGCPESCNGCETPQTCLSCYDQATLQNGDCICPEDSYFSSDTKTCVAYLTDSCSTGCASCKSSDDCFKCRDENAYISNGECICSLGYVPDESLGTAQCNKCKDGCYICESLTNCLFCDNIYQIIQPDGSCKCSDGYYTYRSDDDEYCFQCSTGCKVCNDAFDCSECYDENMIIKDGYCTCPSGTYMNGEDSSNVVCSPCDERCENCDSDTYCEWCKEGYVWQDGECLCGEGSFDYSDGNLQVCKCKKYLACTDTCDGTCGIATCYKCADTAILSNSKCENINIGFKSRFNNGVITIIFTNLNFYLTEKHFIVKSQDGKTFDTENWWLEHFSTNIYRIHTDLTSSDLPLAVTLDFNRY